MAFLHEGPRDTVGSCCHYCVDRQKLFDLPLKPPKRYESLEYYFNGPFEPATAQRTLSSMYGGELANRDVQLDPRLLYVENVYKEVRFVEPDARRRRPCRWERGFSVLAVLGGPEESKVSVKINLECFMMNPVWKLDRRIKMASDFWMIAATGTTLGL